MKIIKEKMILSERENLIDIVEKIYEIDLLDYKLEFKLYDAKLLRPNSFPQFSFSLALKYIKANKSNFLDIYESKEGFSIKHIIKYEADKTFFLLISYGETNPDLFYVYLEGIWILEDEEIS